MRAFISVCCLLALVCTVFAEDSTPTDSQSTQWRTTSPSTRIPWPDVDCDVTPPTPGDVVLLPDPESCSHFYMCVGLKPVRRECPSKLHWNAKKRVCDWPAEAGCDIDLSPDNTEGST